MVLWLSSSRADFQGIGHASVFSRSGIFDSGHESGVLDSPGAEIGVVTMSVQSIKLRPLGFLGNLGFSTSVASLNDLSFDALIFFGLMIGEGGVAFFWCGVGTSGEIFFWRRTRIVVVRSRRPYTNSIVLGMC